VRRERFVCCVLLHARFFSDCPEPAIRAGRIARPSSPVRALRG
jgi:hypothetical protein